MDQHIDHPQHCRKDGKGQKGMHQQSTEQRAYAAGLFLMAKKVGNIESGAEQGKAPAGLGGLGAERGGFVGGRNDYRSGEITDRQAQQRPEEIEERRTRNPRGFAGPVHGRHGAHNAVHIVGAPFAYHIAQRLGEFFLQLVAQGGDSSSGLRTGTGGWGRTLSPPPAVALAMAGRRLVRIFDRPPYSFLQARVARQQHQGHRPLFEVKLRQQRLHPADRFFYRRAVIYPRSGRCRRKHRGGEVADALPGDGHGLDHGHSERFRQPVGIDGDAAVHRLVPHVQVEDAGQAHFGELCCDQQAAAEVLGIDDLQHGPGAAVEQNGPRDLFIFRPGYQAVDPGSVHHLHVLPGQAGRAGADLDGCAGVVRDHNVPAGQLGEDDALADVGVSDKGYCRRPDFSAGACCRDAGTAIHRDRTLCARKRLRLRLNKHRLILFHRKRQKSRKKRFLSSATRYCGFPLNRPQSRPACRSVALAKHCARRAGNARVRRFLSPRGESTTQQKGEHPGLATWDLAPTTEGLSDRAETSRADHELHFPVAAIRTKNVRRGLIPKGRHGIMKVVKAFGKE